MRITRVACGGLLVAFAFAAADSATAATPSACVHGVERPLEGPAARESGLKLASIHPADSSYVTAQTMVVAELEYAIHEFQPDQWQIIAQLETVNSRSTVSGGFDENPELQFARGTLRFCYPLRGAWSSPTVSWPLRLVFHLTRRNDDGSTSVVASSAVTKFNTAELPPAALNRAPPSAEQVAMNDAADKLHAFLESTELHVRLCAAAFPSLKSSLLPPLDAWREQHAKLREKSDALHVRLLRQRHPGISDADLVAFRRAMRTSLAQALREAPHAVSRQNCELMPGRFTDGTYDPSKQHPEAYALVNDQTIR